MIQIAEEKLRDPDIERTDGESVNHTCSNISVDLDTVRSCLMGFLNNDHDLAGRILSCDDINEAFENLSSEISNSVMQSVARAPEKLHPDTEFIQFMINEKVEHTCKLADAKGLAITDQLTNVLNRRGFDDQLLKEVKRARRYGTVFSALTIDVDNFKHINDTYGHEVGDIVLKKIAKVLKTCRNTDFISRAASDQEMPDSQNGIAGRPGGDEFAVLLPETNSKGAKVFAARISKTINELEICVEGRKIEVSVSIGISSSNDFPEAEADQAMAQWLLKENDTQLYNVKEAGRNAIGVNGEVFKFGDILS